MSNAPHARTEPSSWIKSSYSGDEGGNCLEIATDEHSVHLRDSKTPDGPVLSLAPTTWHHFTHTLTGHLAD